MLQSGIDNEPVFNNLEMYRLFEARKQDLGKGGDDENWEALAEIVAGNKNFGDEGSTLRFKMFCDKNCINRKVKISNLGVGS